MGEIQFVKDDGDFSQLLARNKFLVANFTASWCGPCQAIKPMVDGFYASEKYSKIEIVRVDLDTCQLTAAKYVVTSVPTFVFFEAGKEVSRVVGASPKLVNELDNLNAKAVADTGTTGRASAAPPAPAVSKEIAQHIPKGFAVLNDIIHFGDLVALNVLPLTQDADVKNLFKVGEKNATVLSDADSQALFFVPLNNICKVYSILVKFSRPEYREGLELDDEELMAAQAPSLLKIWPNRPGILSFDDASGDAPHVERISAMGEGWYEARVKYVRFQNVQNLNIFVDGHDEDAHTLVEKIVIVGVSGDSKEQGTVQQLEE